MRFCCGYPRSFQNKPLQALAVVVIEWISLRPTTRRSVPQSPRNGRGAIRMGSARRLRQEARCGSRSPKASSRRCTIRRLTCPRSVICNIWRPMGRHFSTTSAAPARICTKRFPLARSAMPNVSGPAVVAPVEPEWPGKNDAEFFGPVDDIDLAVEIPDFQIAAAMRGLVALGHGGDQIENHAIGGGANQRDIFGMRPRQRHRRPGRIAVFQLAIAR